MLEGDAAKLTVKLALTLVNGSESVSSQNGLVGVWKWARLTGIESGMERSARCARLG